MYSSRLRVFTQLALAAVLLFMVAAVPAAFADSRAGAGSVSPDGLPGQAAEPAAAAGPSREMGLAATNIVYDAIPALLPPSMPSLGFQATQTFEFGDWVQLAGTNRALRNVTVTMVTWAHYATYSADPSYNPASWSHPITLNIYNFVPGTPLNTKGTLLGTVTQMVTIPWRPAADPTCETPTAWRASDGNCYNGFAFNITLDMSSLNLTLPNDIIVGIAYNTQTYGVAPIGVTGPYDSLNVGLDGSVTVGTDGNPDRVFWNTITPGWYTDSGAGGVGIFREDTNWTPYVVPIQITAAPTVPSEVYVNPAWASVPPGQDPDGAGPAGQMGYDAFTTIQAGVNAVGSGGTVNVAEGTYVEQVVVDNKAVTIDGQGAATIIQAPNIVPTCFVVSSANRKPIVCAKDGASLILKDLTVDGAGQGNSNNRFFGVAFRNAGGEISNIALKDVRDTPFSGAQHGVGVYSFNDDAIGRTIKLLNSTIVGFQKNATAFIAGDTTPLVLDIQGNTITGAGTTTVTAQNGIQIDGKLVTGSVIGNTITGIAYDGGSWVATGILDYYSAVDIKDNTLTGCHTCIYKIEGSGEISGNTLTVIKASGYSWGIVASDPPNAKPSPYVEEAMAVKVSVAAVPAATLQVAVTNNAMTFSGSDNKDSVGIEADAGYGTDDIALSATANSVSGFDYGIYLGKCVPSATTTCFAGTFSSVAVNGNCISSNTTYGMYVDDFGSALNAKSNWWGAVSGPYHATKNPIGTGNAVGDNLTFAPWLNACGGAPTGNYQNTTTGEFYATLQDAVDAAHSGDTIKSVTGGTLPGGTTVGTSGVTIDLQGATIGHGSPAITVNANDTTILNGTLDGTSGDPTDSGITVNAGVQRLYIHDLEIKNWPADGIHFNGAITDLKIIDNYIHTNDSDGIEFASGPAGFVQIYGNAFRSNDGAGINAVSGSVAAEYNEWGSYDGPAVGGDGVAGTVNYSPWVFGKVYADVVPEPARVRETESFAVDIKADAKELYGAEFTLSFDPAKLEVTALAFIGAGYLKESGDCAEKSYDNTLGTVEFQCSRQGADLAVSGPGVKLLTITFKAKEIGGTSTTAAIDIATPSLKLSAPAAVRIFVDSVTDDTVTILGTTSVNGRVDLQGRGNDADAVVDPGPGSVDGWNPAAYTTASWGTYSFVDMTDGTYTIGIEMARYLDASASVVVGGDSLPLGTVVLLGGDVNDDDQILIGDVSSIGGRFGDAVDPATTAQDINYDGWVNIFDLVLAAGNFEKTSSPWTP